MTCNKAKVNTISMNECRLPVGGLTLISIHTEVGLRFGFKNANMYIFVIYETFSN